MHTPGRVWAGAAPQFLHLEAAEEVDACLPRLSGKPQHVQGTRGDMEAEQGPICLRLLGEDPF